MTAKIETLKSMGIGPWILFSVVAACCAALVGWAPPTMWEALGKADWPHVAGGIGIVSAAIALGLGRIVAAWRAASAPAPSLAPPVLRPLDDAEDTARLGRRSRDGFAVPHALLGVAVLTAVIVACALAASGCGASPTRVHASIATVSIDTARVARQALVDAVERRIAECAALELAARGACLDSAEASDSAAGAALDAALLAIAIYRDEVRATAARGDDPETASAVLERSHAYAVSHWRAFIEIARALGVNVDILTAGGEA